MNGRPSIIRIISALLVCGCASILFAQTSENSPHLKKALESYPEADANKDGILTRAEALAFRDKARSGARLDPPDRAAAPEQLAGQRHVYKTVNDRALALYAYLPTGHDVAGKAPAMVFFHGGGWTSGSPQQLEPQCRYLAERGMVAITVEYRLASQSGSKIEDCIEDARSAMRWVRANATKLGIDPNRIGAGGGSAGGHLAATTAVFEEFNAASDPAAVSAVPNSLVLFNPVMGIEGEVVKEQSRRMNPLSRGGLAECMPLAFADRKQPACLMFYGTADPLLEGAKLYQSKSLSAGNQCSILTYEGQGHGFFNGGKYFDLTMAETDRFLTELGWLTPRQPPQTPR